MDPSTDVDRVLEALGGVGKYQLFQLSLHFIIMLENAFHLIAANYISFRPDYRCADINTTNFIQQYTDIEPSNVSDILIDYGKCDVNVYVNVTGTEYHFSKSCPNGYHYGIRRDQSTVSEWDLVCDKAARSEWAQTMIMMGQGLGAAIFSPLSDRFGRKPINILARSLYIIAGVTAMFSPSIAVFSVYRLLIGTFQQGSVITGSTILSELLPTSKRHRGEGLAGVAWTTGIVFTSIIGYICRDMAWRNLQLVLGLLSWHVIIDWIFFDESLRWLVANGKMAQAEKIIKRSAKWNGKSYEKVIESIQKQDLLLVEELNVKTPENGEPKPEDRQNQEELLSIEGKNRVQKYSVITILKHKRILTISLLLYVCWITNTMTYYGLMLTTSKLAGDRYVNNILASLSEFPALFIQQILINRIGRRYTLVFFHALAGVTLIIATVCFTYSSMYPWLPPLSTFFSILGRFASIGSFISIFLYTPELYPTNLRNVGLGMASAISRIGSMISPFAGLLVEYVFWGPAVIFATLNAIVTIILLTFPETMGRELPTTVEEMKVWFKGRKGIFDVKWPSTYRKMNAKKTRSNNGENIQKL